VGEFDYVGKNETSRPVISVAISPNDVTIAADLDGSFLFAKRRSTGKSCSSQLL
jgi:hypothetical protein